MALGGQRGSGFVGLQSYLGLNRAAGERMGDELTREVEEKGAAAKGEVDAATNAFTAAAQKGTPQYNTTTAMLEPGALGEAARQGRIAYAGPRELSEVADTSKLAQHAADAERLAKLAGTDAGRSVLLRQKYGTTSLGGGMLDAALAGRGGGEGLEKASAGYSGLRDYLGLAQQGAQQQATQGEKDAKSLSEQYKREFPMQQVQPRPAPLAPLAPTQAPRPIPQVGNAQKIADENKRKARAGFRG